MQYLNMNLSIEREATDGNWNMDMGSFSPMGHNFMSLLVAFLVVSRTTMALNNWWQMVVKMMLLFRTAGELVQTTVTLTQDENDKSAQEWRNEVANRTMLFVRTVNAVLTWLSEYS
jgi:hypothetical protein